MLAAASSSARGGRNSAAMTGSPEWKASSRVDISRGLDLDQYTERLMPGAAHSLAAIPVIRTPSAVHELAGLRRALGGGPRILIKRDDGIGFAFGGNKVRKM